MSGEATPPSDADATGAAASQATTLVQIGSEAELFHDSFGKGYARMEISGHFEIWPLRSERFRNWLSFEYYRRQDKVAKSDAVSAARSVLEGMARFEGAEHQLHNRVAWHEGAIYYDLADARWRAVRIDRDGWRIIERPPILFRRYDHQRPQPEPLPGGDSRRALEFLNVRSEDQLLLLAWLTTAFVPGIPHPVPDFHGEKGSGKTVGQRALRRLIDPSKVETLAFPRDKQELVQILDHHYAPVFDNLDGLPAWLSDMMCRAVTGEGFSKRQLYSDDEDVIYSYRRVVMLNGINVMAQRSDLLDRTILIALERIPKERRRPEAEFWAEFEEAQPFILGGLFDLLSRAMGIQADLEISDLERMADFTRWGAAVSEALGDGKDSFLTAYANNVGVQTREAVEGDIVGAAILALMNEREEWSGKATDLLIDLEEAGIRDRLFSRRRSARLIACPLRTLVSLSPGVPRIEVRVAFENRAEDHRLRVHFPTGISTGVSHAEQHFGVVQRPVALPAADESWMEQPAGYHPQKSFVDLNDGRSGLLIANRGLPEYEVLEMPDGATIALTLLRSVGWLSRNDFPARKGHAGPPLPTPGAQCLGSHIFEYAIVPHEGGWEQAYREAHEFAAPLRGRWNPAGSGLLAPSASLVEIEGEGLVLSALKRAEDGSGVIVRLYNILDRSTRGRLRLTEPWTKAEVVDLKEDVLRAATIRRGWVELELRPNEITTYLFTA